MVVVWRHDLASGIENRWSGLAEKGNAFAPQPKCLPVDACDHADRHQRMGENCSQHGAAGGRLWRANDGGDDELVLIACTIVEIDLREYARVGLLETKAVMPTHFAER